MTEVMLDAHRKNLRRYCELLANNLTDQERQYLHRRIVETRLAIDRLESGSALVGTHLPETTHSTSHVTAFRGQLMATGFS